MLLPRPRLLPGKISKATSQVLQLTDMLNAMRIITRDVAEDRTVLAWIRLREQAFNGDLTETVHEIQQN